MGDEFYHNRRYRLAEELGLGRIFPDVWRCLEKKVLLLVSGNGIDKGIRKTKFIKKKKPSEFKINESSINAYISQKTR